MKPEFQLVQILGAGMREIGFLPPAIDNRSTRILVSTVNQGLEGWIMPISRFPAVGNHRISRNRHSLSNCLFLDSWTCFLRESRIGQALQTISSSIRGVERKGRVKSYGGSIFSLSFPEPPFDSQLMIRPARRDAGQVVG